jgi:hypothetical protein
MKATSSVRYGRRLDFFHLSHLTAPRARRLSFRCLDRSFGHVTSGRRPARREPINIESRSVGKARSIPFVGRRSGARRYYIRHIGQKTKYRQSEQQAGENSACVCACADCRVDLLKYALRLAMVRGSVVRKCACVRVRTSCHDSFVIELT